MNQETSVSSELPFVAAVGIEAGDGLGICESSPVSIATTGDIFGGASRYVMLRAGGF